MPNTPSDIYSGHKSFYQSYILRFWQEGQDSWRIKLEPISNKTESKYFSDIDSLLLYLKNSKKMAIGEVTISQEDQEL